MSVAFPKRQAMREATPETRTTMRKSRTRTLSTLICTLAGCAAQRVVDTTHPRPVVADIVETSARVGQPLHIRGFDFATPARGWVEVVFDGDFVTLTGTRTHTRRVVPLTANAAGTELIWPNFGVYWVPFGPGNEIGAFEGRVYAMNQYKDGQARGQTPDSATLIRLPVDPSIIVTNFVATDGQRMADCMLPTTTALEGELYDMTVEALGFQPRRVDFALPAGTMVGDQAANARTVSAEMTSSLHSILVRFAPVPEYTPGYTAAIAVSMTDTAGAVHQLTYTVVVRRRVQVFFPDGPQIAELLPPEPVSGCIPGGGSSVAVSYAESRTETRVRGSSESVDSGWQQSFANSQEQSSGFALTNSNGGSRYMTKNRSDTTIAGTQITRDLNIGISGTSSRATTDGWDRGVDAQIRAGGKVGGLVDVGGSVGGHLDWNHSVTTANSTTGSVNGGRAETSFSPDYRQRNEGFTNGSERNWMISGTASFGQAQSQSQSLSNSGAITQATQETVSSSTERALSTTAWVWAGQFGSWYRQTVRLARVGEARAFTLCGESVSLGRVVYTDWTWAPDLAVGRTCPPPSNLPAAECRIEPCVGR